MIGFHLPLLLALLAPTAKAANVLSIGDGDTITVSEGSQRIKVRFACIDAPETSQAPYGLAARQKLQGLLPIGSQVTLKTKATDRYGRSVAEVFKVGTNINQTLVGSGDAFVYWQYISGCDRETYSQLETDARAQGIGVWSVTGGIQRPWDYRRSRRGNRASTSGASGGGRYRCKEIGSWSKAQELLKQGHTYLDRDGDGEACETLK
ncbi:thermonuclease family protein [Cyanobium sp. WAJ14-Wanaka]|nr:thermonuclease family protein [Cyanobium sp. WAJ14-Wanaka]